ncbi:MAG TPA: hypothetical protein VIM17_08510 [Jatrophihabitantaceae bacterium]
MAGDGADGSGKSVFADQLAAVLREQDRPVVRASVDDFHRPRAERYRPGRHSPSGFRLDSFDYDLVRREALGPLGPGGSRRHRAAVHDVRTDRQLELPQVIAAPGSVLVLDGLLLHRDELHADTSCRLCHRERRLGQPDAARRPIFQLGQGGRATIAGRFSLATRA